MNFISNVDFNMSVYKLPVFSTKHNGLFQYHTKIDTYNFIVPDNVIENMLRWLNGCRLPIRIANVPQMGSAEFFKELTYYCAESSPNELKPFLTTLDTILVQANIDVWEKIMTAGTEITINDINVENTEVINQIFHYIGLNLALDPAAYTNETIAPNMLFTSSQLIALSMIYWYVIHNATLIENDLSDLEIKVLKDIPQIENHIFCMLFVYLVTDAVNTKLWVENKINSGISYVKMKLMECPEFVALQKHGLLTNVIKDKIETFIDNNYLHGYQLLPHILYENLSQQCRSKKILNNLMLALNLTKKEEFPSLTSEIDPDQKDYFRMDEFLEKLDALLKYMENEYSLYPSEILTLLIDCGLLDVAQKLSEQITMGEGLKLEKLLAS